MALTLITIGSVGLLLVWLGYPALVGLSSLFSRRPRKAAALSAERDRPSVTAVMATVAPPERVLARVDNFLASDYPSGLLDVVVALDAGAGYAVDEFPESDRVRFVAGDAPGGKAATLNAAVRQATGALLVFGDDNQLFEPSAVPALVGAMSDDRLGACSGALYLSPSPTVAGKLVGLYWKLERWLRSREARLHSAVGVSGSIYCARRSLWQPLPTGLILDDLYFPMRLLLAGHRIGFEPTARAHETRAASVDFEYLRKVRTLTGNLQLIAWLPQALLPWRNPIWPQFVCHKLLRFLTPYLLLALVAGAGGLVADLAGWPGWLVFGAIALGAVAVWVLPIPGLRRVREGFRAVVSLQAAVVMATANGIRGRWDVWARR